MGTVVANAPERREAAARRRIAPWALAAVLAALAAAVAYRFIAIGMWPGSDSLYALVWARDLFNGVRPAFDDYRTPTQHPLLIGVGALLLPLGDAAPRALVVLSITGLIALAAAVWRLGRIVGGLLGALVAAALLLTRFDIPWMAALGFVDVPYCALVTWALVLEVQRPRRGGAVWMLLGLAGLLRPEAWLLSGLYAVWVLRGDHRRYREAVLGVTAAPLIWMSTDLLVTGNALFSAHHVHAIAAELGRGRPSSRLPELMLKHLEEILKPPVLLAGAAGIAIAIALGQGIRAGDDPRVARALAACGALIGATCANWTVIASNGGLAIIYRYLLTAAVGLIVMCAFAVSGWSLLEASRLRTSWAAIAAAIIVPATIWSAAHLDPAAIRPQLEQRAASHAQLRALLAEPAFTAARGCGPISVPNHKLIPYIRWSLRLPAGAVVARSLEPTRPPTTGIAIVIDRRAERRKELDVREGPNDPPDIQVPPPGFRPIAHNATFAAWARCPGWSFWRLPRAG